MTLSSILFPAGHASGAQPATPDFFADLHLDQIIAAVVAGKEEYALEPFFHEPLHDGDAIAWRHEVMQDLEGAPLFTSIQTFAQRLRTMRKRVVQADKLDFQLQKQRWFLDAVAAYCAAVTGLARDLSDSACSSRGLTAFREYLARYAASERFVALLAQTEKLATDLAAIHYTVLIQGLHVRVRRHGGDPDYSTEVEATFEPFQRGAAKDYTFTFSAAPEMDPVEAKVLTLVAQLYPETFLGLEHYYGANQSCQDATILAFDREIQFYIAYLEHAARFRKTGLTFCYPRMAQANKEVYNDEGFDLALAGKLIAEGAAIVRNDFRLSGPERVLVVTGPNQGGKTTFARTFGQLHYLASLGCPVPGTRAQLFLFDQIFTHFEREESIRYFGGKLQDDLLRIREILERATSDSILILNEVFVSTTLRDAVALSKKIALKIAALDALCVWVTFVNELASLNEQTVSMASTIDPGNPALRTYKILRRPADGLAYAMAIAEKYQLTYAMIQKRIGP